MVLSYRSVRSSSWRRGGNGLKEVDGGIIILASCANHIIRVNENLVQHPSNNISITITNLIKNKDNIILQKHYYCLAFTHFCFEYEIYE